MKESQFVFDGFELVDPSNWCMSFDVAAHALCACHSSKMKIFLFLECQSMGAHVWNVGSSVYCPSILNISTS